ncbi:hypothetical protein GIB67_033271 [Kingdonia uniflora]|uniref:Cytochrome P450 n=1 Tax=Kingdonia uniflora TaxID=39325 RepID=A0A7J7MPW5_9MAGN|nr:hypothetical protein GIB67_033271 [Kingdonia uniflora]
MVKLQFMVQWLSSQVETPLNPISAFLLILFSLLFLIKLNGVWSKKFNLPPSPPKLPFIGNLHQLGGVAHRTFRDLSKKYGPIIFLHLGRSSIVIVSSPDIAREIMKTQDIKFSNRLQTTAAKTMLYGCNDLVFAPYCECYRRMRKICVQELLSVSRVQSFKYIREEEVALMIQKISRSCSMQTPVNIAEMALTLSNNLACRCALGTKSEDGNKEISEMSREVSRLLGALCFEDLYPSLGWIDVLTGLRSRFRKVTRDIDTYLEQIIDEHISKTQEDDSKQDFLDLLLRVQVDINLTRENIKGLLLDMFLGGTETTATAIEWVMAELARKPSALKKTQEEVRRVVGLKSKVCEEEIDQMEYLKYVIKETLRLHAPVPTGVPRVSDKHTTVNGYDIPPNTTVLINIWAIQRDPDVWDNPDDFIPERFSGSSTDFGGQDYEFIPFGSGRRICPGISFAVAIVEVAIANLLFHFDWELPGGTNAEELDMIEEISISANMRTPLQLVPKACFS